METKPNGNLAACVACQFRDLWGKYYYLACCQKSEYFMLDFGINRCLDS